MPKSNVSFWQNKFRKNVERDRKNLSKLRDLGWNALVVWECELKDPESLMQFLCRNLFSEENLSDLEKVELMAAEEMGGYECGEGD